MPNLPIPMAVNNPAYAEDPSMAGLSGNIVPGVADNGPAQGVGTGAPAPASGGEGSLDNKANEPDDSANQDVVHNVQQGLSGILSHLGAGLAAANVGTAPKGAGALYGFTKAAGNYHDIRRQEIQDDQKKQQQQFENNEKMKSDKRADTMLQNSTDQAKAEIALHNAQLIAAQHGDQQAQALAPYMIAEEKSKLDTINNQRVSAEQDLKKHLLEAGVSADELEDDFQAISELPPNTGQNAAKGNVMGIGNAQQPAPGQDQDGVHLISNPQEVLSRKLQKDTQILTGYKPNKSGGFDPVMRTVSAGTTLSSVLAAHDSAMEQLSQQQEQLTNATTQRVKEAQIKRDAAETNKANAGEWKIDAATGQMYNDRTGEIKTGAGAPAGNTWQPKVGESEKTKTNLAENVGENAESIKQILERRPDLVGVISGRITNVEQLVGNNDADLSKIGIAIQNLAKASVGIHGMRSYQGVEAGEKAMLNGFHNGPDAIKGALDEQEQSAQTFIDSTRSKDFGTHSANGGVGNFYARQLTQTPKGTPASQLHMSFKDFAHNGNVQGVGKLYTDDNKTYYKADGTLYQGAK